MPNGYTHLTCNKRCQIEALLQSGKSKAQVADQPGTHRSTITRELQRNGQAGDYNGQKAHNEAVARRKKASSIPRKIDWVLVEMIENALRNMQWSPDQISGWLARCKIFVSHEWIYQHVWRDKKKGGDLWTNLRPFRRPIACAI